MESWEKNKGKNKAWHAKEKLNDALKQLRSDTIDFMNSLSNEDSKLIYKYAGSSYTNFNKAVLNPKAASEYNLRSAKRLDWILQFSPVLKHNVLLYRGLGFNNLSPMNKPIQNEKYFQQTPFMSTSYDIKVSQKFAKDNDYQYLFYITVPKGSRALYIPILNGEMYDEREVLFDVGYGLEKKGQSVTGKKYKIYYTCKYCTPEKAYTVNPSARPWNHTGAKSPIVGGKSPKALIAPKTPSPKKRKVVAKTPSPKKRKVAKAKTPSPKVPKTPSPKKKTPSPKKKTPSPKKKASGTKIPKIPKTPSPKKKKVSKTPSSKKKKVGKTPSPKKKLIFK